ncbi:hypothetical protein [Neorhodopirellula lusitana]|uniref:hypothetical protein n=1 Tax=Neorhodopirellula lusitana TaxID=445327 RepID=UPI00384CE314
MSHVRSIAVLALFLCVPTCPAALILNPTFDNSGAATWDAAREGVVNQAIADWQNVITGISDGMGGITDITVNFNVDFTDVAGSYLGQWSGGASAFLGADIRPWEATDGSYNVTHDIHFNAAYFTGANQLWFDPTPTDDGLDKAFADWDALTVARHEIGHMLGFSGLYSDEFGTAAESNPWSDLIDGEVFDPTGLSIAMEPGDVGHVLDDALLMDTALGNNEYRIGISQTEAQMLSLAYGYTLNATAVPEPNLFLALAGVAGFCRLMPRRKRRVLAAA